MADAHAAAARVPQVSSGRNAIRTVRVWDPLVRIFHWFVATGVILNLFILEPGKYWHRTTGYAVAIAFARSRAAPMCISARSAPISSRLPLPRTRARSSPSRAIRPARMSVWRSPRFAPGCPPCPSLPTSRMTRRRRATSSRWLAPACTISCAPDSTTSGSRSVRRSPARPHHARRERGRDCRRHHARRALRAAIGLRDRAPDRQRRLQSRPQANHPVAARRHEGGTIALPGSAICARLPPAGRAYDGERKAGHARAGQRSRQPSAP